MGGSVAKSAEGSKCATDACPNTCIHDTLFESVVYAICDPNPHTLCDDGLGGFCISCALKPKPVETAPVRLSQLAFCVSRFERSKIRLAEPKETLPAFFRQNSKALE